MVREQVVSSSLRSVGYDADRRRLEIEFVNGGLYRYLNVPLRIHRELLAAPSHGRYFNQRIRDRFAYRRIN